jgi:hypothetical protein
MEKSSSVSEAAAIYGTAVADLRQPLILQQANQPWVVIVPFEEYQHLRALADDEVQRRQAVQLRLKVDQISAAIMLLSKTEKRELQQRLPTLIGIDQDALEDLGWLHLAETSFAFWADAEEDIYNDLISPVGTQPKA